MWGQGTWGALYGVCGGKEPGGHYMEYVGARNLGGIIWSMIVSEL